jgi:hypothetical protein
MLIKETESSGSAVKENLRKRLTMLTLLMTKNVHYVYQNGDKERAIQSHMTKRTPKLVHTKSRKTPRRKKIRQKLYDGNR